MPSYGILDAIPLWGVFIASVLIVLLAVESGHRLGRFRRSRSEHEKEAPVGAMVGAMLGLLALLLAFTFGVAAARFDARRVVLHDEANAIGTTYLRADFLDDPHREKVKQLLRDYVDLRLEAVRTRKLESLFEKSDTLHAGLWAEAAAAGRKNPNSIVVGLFIESLNEVIDLHSTRVMIGLRSRIPGTIWAILYFVVILSLCAMGYHGGLAGTSRSLATLVVALAFSAVIWLIADLDRPQEGMLTVSQQPMVDLRNSMTKPGKE